MTLFVLESGLTQASEVTKKFFKRTKMFFVRKNHNGTISFISATFPEDILTTSSIKDFSQAENGYMRIVTQNSVINVTPFVVGCSELHPYQVEEMIGYCPFVKTELVPYETYYLNNKMFVEGKEDLIFISKDSSYGFNVVNGIEGWEDCETRLFKDTEGYLYLEDLTDFEGENISKHTHHFQKTNIKIG